MERQFVVEFKARLRSQPPLEADDITDLVEFLVDELDEAPGLPSVGTTGIGDGIELRIELIVVCDSDVEALSIATPHISRVLDAANIDAPRLLATDGLTSSVHSLEAV